MIRNLRQSKIAFATVAGYLCLLAGIANGETWTDKSGNYQVEAEFVGLEDRSVVLRKIDGSTVKVPIDRLSAESRAQAKRLYEMSKSRSVGGGAPPTRGTDAGINPEIQIVQAHARKVLEAPYKGDVDSMLSLAHPRLIEKAGGIDVMRRHLVGQLDNESTEGPDELSQELESIEFPEDPTFVRVK